MVITKMAGDHMAIPVDDKEFLLQATTRISSSLDLETSLQRCLEYLGQVIPAQFLGVNLYEADLGVVRNIAYASTEGLALPAKGLVVPLEKEARQFLDSIRLPHTRILNRPMDDPTGKSFSLALGSDRFSIMVIYMDVEGAWLANLGVVAEGPDRYNEEHLRLFSLLKDPLVIAVSNALRHLEIIKLKDMLAEENRYLAEELYRSGDMEIVGRESGLRAVMDLVREVSLRDSPVLLLGETGAGKDVIAKAIHFSSPRRRGPFIKVNCGAIPETLVDSELFGHEKGAFTGALARKAGRFERAHGGTILLDEIGELPAPAQVRLLRVLQDREIERVGGTSSIPLDIRVIAATNQDLERMIKDNRFRLDLWFRLQVFPIMIPPLRERREDIPALVMFFINSKSRELKIYPTPGPARGAMDRLTAYHWPGNVRELENLVERELILSKGRPLAFEELSASREGAGPMVPGEPLRLDAVVAGHIRRVLALCQGRVGGPGGAGELLGVHPNTLRHRMKRLGVPYGRKSDREEI